MNNMVNNVSINMMETGKNIKRLLTERGYSVRQIQNYLHLACPQSVYRWFNGEKLPSVDNLYALSVLLNVHMEELLVSDGEKEEAPSGEKPENLFKERMCAYFRYFFKSRTA